jgi:hypothetical protein
MNLEQVERLEQLERRLEVLEESGPWPFVSRRTYRHPDGSTRAWQSRHHRKGLRVFEPLERRPLHVLLLIALWMPQNLNWWIGSVFALGATLFALGSVLVLVPDLAQALSVDANPVFFAGSIPFTAAAYMQLFQAANAGDPAALDPRHDKRISLIGWKPKEIGWLSCFLQFIGTLLFNANTFDAMIPGLGWWQEDLAVWVPNLVGSILFLASGYLAFGETCHAYWAWRPRSLAWWITFANLLGCIAFMLSAGFAFVPKVPFAFDAATLSVVFTLLGAIGFFVGSLLMLPEAADDGSPEKAADKSTDARDAIQQPAGPGIAPRATPTAPRAPFSTKAFTPTVAAQLP